MGALHRCDSHLQHSLVGRGMGHAMTPAQALSGIHQPARLATEPATETDFVLRDLVLGYGGRVVVDGLSGSFARGSLTAIVGPNGGGKTTLVKALLGLLPILQGVIETRPPRQGVGYLAQRGDLDLTFPVRVEDFVTVGLWAHMGVSRAIRPALKNRVDEALRCVGLQDFGQRWMEELSGGQLQRMRFARLVVQDAPVIVLDEPFTGLDTPTMEALMQVIAHWHAQGRTVLAVLHDLRLVQAHFPQTLALAGRPLAWGRTADALAALAEARAAK